MFHRNKYFDGTPIAKTEFCFCFDYVSPEFWLKKCFFSRLSSDTSTNRPISGMSKLNFGCINSTQYLNFG